MIPVVKVDEPADFDAKVRQPGLNAIDEMVGEAKKERSGPKRKQYPDRQSIPSSKFPPLWRCALDDLHAAYHGICAYSCLYITLGVGSGSVDHFVPVSRDWEKAYEWSNYRLACQQINANKSNYQDVLDPFKVEIGWFELDLDFFFVKVGASAPLNRQVEIKNTIATLRLNEGDFPGARRAYADEYWNKNISQTKLMREAPFVGMELERLGRLVQESAT